MARMSPANVSTFLALKQLQRLMYVFCNFKANYRRTVLQRYELEAKCSLTLWPCSQSGGLGISNTARTKHERMYNEGI